MTEKQKKPKKIIYRANYGDATPEQVARALHQYRPGQPVRHDEKARDASTRSQA
ncbi:hypothetical protein [Candidatus Palauibacter sp.]|uniref:hypothetical protein n=1 Tax=Candidatus Palauibacter sp. TaxID=3101350 RepID=UPI003B5BCF96